MTIVVTWQLAALLYLAAGFSVVSVLSLVVMPDGPLDTALVVLLWPALVVMGAAALIVDGLSR